jgi:hypothetical protein
MITELVPFNIPRGLAAIRRTDEVSLGEYERVGFGLEDL